MQIHYTEQVSAQIDAVYENGVLRPLQRLDLAEHEHVVITVARMSSVSGRSSLAVEYIERLRKEIAPGLEDVRLWLARISGSMANEIITARGNC